MGKDVLMKIIFGSVILVLIVLVVFGKDIMAAVTETMTEQTGSLMDQLLR